MQWSASGICKQNIPSSQLFAATAICSSEGSGLNAEYFSNIKPQENFPLTPTSTTTTPTVDFNWAGGGPPNISNDNFKARFTGYIQTLDAGVYTFYVTADDGIRLWVDGQLLIDKWVDQGATEYSNTLNLQGCKKYAIKIEYYENTGDAVCKLEWSGPVIGRSIVPAAQLFSQPDNNIAKDFVVFPNPAKNIINVFFKSGFTAGQTIILHNILGQKIIQKELTSSNTGTTITISVEHLPSGLYIITLHGAGQKYAEKVLITR